MVNLVEISEALINGKAPVVVDLVNKALSEGTSPQEIMNKALIPGMDVVGKKFKANEFYVPEVLVAARAMQGGLNILKPLLAEAGVKQIGTVVVGTVKGDLHDIGKNLVAMMLEGAGFKVVDLGIDVPPEKFVSAAVDNNAQVIGMSALLTTTMLSMKNTVEALRVAGLGDKIKTLIGGAPVTQKYADEIGATGYSPDAASAVEKAKEVIGIAA
ncbi:MAG: corrinoid protein [bacterium]|jgi:5-methyltetrahydrofolate--homocysteine methyltransferase